MKLFSISTSLKSRATSLYQIILRQLLSSRSISSRRIINGSDSGSLYRRLSPLGDPHLSMLPVLDGWIREGNAVNKPELQRVIEQLRSYKRFKHALEVSLWMTNKRRFHTTPYDAAVRLKLMFKVFGLKKVENYFNKIPENMKTFSVYLTLLNCYTMAKSVDKAESIMQKARDLGYANNSIWYNLMMNLHHQLGNVKRLGDLLTEMEARGIPYDSFTFSVCLSAFAGASNVEGMDKSVMIMESDPRVNLHWRTYAIAAEGYWRIGSMDKALTMLKKLEGHLKPSERKNHVLIVLFNVYTKIGKKDELYQLWNLFKQNSKVGNKVYMSMMRSLVKFDDIDGAERIFEEWESSGSQIDFRIQNVLINAYCTHGLLEKAEALITKGISKGGNPFVITWLLLAGGYLKQNKVPKAVEALKKAISISQPMHNLKKNSLTTCLEFLESGAYMEKEEEFTKFTKMEGNSLETFFDKLFVLIKDEQLQLHSQLCHGSMAKNIVGEMQMKGCINGVQADGGLIK